MEDAGEAFIYKIRLGGEGARGCGTGGADLVMFLLALPAVGSQSVPEFKEGVARDDDGAESGLQIDGMCWLFREPWAADGRWSKAESRGIRCPQKWMIWHDQLSRRSSSLGAQPRLDCRQEGQAALATNQPKTRKQNDGEGHRTR